MRTNFFIALLPLTCMGCVSATASDTLSITEPLHFTRSAVAPSISPTLDATTSVPVNTSAAITKLQQFGSPSFSVIQSTLTGNISFAKHLSVSIANDDLGTLSLIDADVSGTSTTNQFPLLVSGDQLLPYLSEPSTLTFSLSGTIPASGVPPLDYTLGLSVSETVNKGI